MQELVLHPDCASGPAVKVSASIVATRDGCEAEFRIEGDVAGMVIPEHAEAERMDFLWKTTCFEIFWQPDGDSYYREFNLSPSSRWACYDFDGFRENSRDAPVEAISIVSTQDSGALVLKASIASELPTPAQVALNAIVEDSAGNIQFWALAFAEGKPEFHSEVCRHLRVERSS